MKNSYQLISGTIIFLMMATCYSCKKDATEISNTPSIEFISIAPSTVKELTDSIVIRFSYKDGDADLGENSADAKNLFITDLRNNALYEFRIQQLSPETGIAIEGNLNAVINNTLILNQGNSQQVNYNVQVKDRAGNLSNVITSSLITVVK